MLNKVMFFLFSLAYFALVGFAGYVMYQDNKANMLMLIDTKLVNGANVVPFILGEDFHNKNLSAKTLTKDQDLKNINQLSQYVKQTDLAYIYSFILDENGTVRFASSSATKEDIDANKSDIFSFDVYNDPDIIKAIQTKKTVFKTVKDKWGEFRSVYIPKISPDGRVYVVGADYRLKDVQTFLDMVAKNSQIFFLVVFIILLLYLGLVYFAMHYVNDETK